MRAAQVTAMGGPEVLRVADLPDPAPGAEELLVRVEAAGVPDPLRLTAGDGVLLPRGRPFRLVSDLDAEPADAHALLGAARPGSLFTVNGGGDTALVGGYFGLTGPHADIFLGLLPPVVHLRTDADRAVLRWSLERMREELRDAVAPRTVALVVGVLLLQLGFVLSYVGAFHDPSPHRVPVRVVGPAAATSQFVTGLDAIAGRPVDATATTDRPAAEAALAASTCHSGAAVA